jgi:hypothetical protein
LAVFLIDQEYTAEEILNNNDIDIEKLREEYLGDSQKTFCCKHTRKANRLIRTAYFKSKSNSIHEAKKEEAFLFLGVGLVTNSRPYQAMNDYKC